MIRLRDIHKSFGDLEVLHGVNLEIGEREIVVIVGPSGAGKTTLLQIAGSLEAPTRGSVEYDGVELTSLSDRKLSRFRNRNIGFVFQFHQLLPEFSAAENVALPAMIGGMRRSKALRQAETLLCDLGLAERLNHKPTQLSGGERQRVAFARALINEPRVVLADEPTGSLDSHNRQEIHHLISELRDRYGQTFVIVTHDQEMTSIADRVIRMEDGRISGIELRETLPTEETLPEP